MISYDQESMPNENVSADGINFKWDKPFFLICNKPLVGKLYFEIVIDSYYPIYAFHDIPLYIGVSREVSYGTLNSDFCIGSVYYEDGKNYDIQEKYNNQVENLHRSPTTLYTRKPGATDVIGVGVDVGNNRITIYVNGNAFYDFSPTQFHLSDHKFYFCIYSDIWYNRVTADGTDPNYDNAKYIPGKNITGHVNFGKIETDFTPPGYSSIYNYYYKREPIVGLIDVDVTVDTSDVKTVSGFMDMDCDDILNTIKDKTLYLITTSNNARIEDKIKYTMTSDPSITDNLMYGTNIFINLPIPTDRKVYFEFTAAKGILKDNLIGIPLSVGLSNLNTSILSRSMRLHLYHDKQTAYQYALVESLIQNVYEMTEVDTTVIPAQGKTIGIALDLCNNEITVYINKVKFCTLQSNLIDFSIAQNRTYFFIHDDNMFSESVSGEFNFGESEFDMDIPDGYISLYEYYSTVFRKIIYLTIDCDCNIKRDNYRAESVYCDCWIDSYRFNRPDPKRFGNLTFLYDSYTILTDEERYYYEPDTGTKELNTLIAQGNGGYYPTNEEKEFVNNFDDDIEASYNIIIKQVPNQTIWVKYQRQKTKESFKAKEGEILEVNAIPDAGYDAGIISPGSYITVYQDTTITSSNATVRQYTVVVQQYTNQQIYVECNGKVYRDTFTTTYGTSFTVTIDADDGYIPGILNITTGTVTSDINIVATPPSIEIYPITIVQGQHYTIGVMYAGTEFTQSFNAKYGSSLTVYVKSVEEGYVAPTITQKTIIVDGPIQINYGQSQEDTCSLYVVGVFDGTVSINGNYGSVFRFKKGAKITIDINPSEGYYIDDAVLSTQ